MHLSSSVRRPCWAVVPVRTVLGGSRSASSCAAFGKALSQAQQAPERALASIAGQPTPFIGLEERIGFSAYYLWQSVLAAALWRRRPNLGGEEAVAPPRKGAPIVWHH